MKLSWDEKFIRIATEIASWSKDQGTKVGAVIVGPDREIRSTGYNGFCRGVNDDVPRRHDRPAKYMWTEHAERNAVYNAARIGVSLIGCTLYMNFEPLPCTDCARAIIQSGIARVVGPNTPFPGYRAANRKDWDESFKITAEMFEEAGIETLTVR